MANQPSEATPPETPKPKVEVIEAGFAVMKVLVRTVRRSSKTGGKEKGQPH